MLDGYFVSIPFGPMYHARTFTPKPNRPSINIVYNGIDPNTNSFVQRVSHLDITHHISLIEWYCNLTPTGRFFDTTIDVDY
jgi:hypothetical protein